MAVTYKTDFGIKKFLISVGNFSIPHFKRWCQITGFKINQKNNEGKKLFLDSGAFSVYYKNADIPFHYYVDFVQRFGKTFDVIASMDVIGNAESSFNNYKDMLRLGFDNIIPTYHQDLPIEWFDKYCKMTDYIAIGKLAKLNFTDPSMTLHIIRKLIDRKPRGVKLHLFGIGSSAILKKIGYLIESCDHSGWLAGQKFSSMASRYGKRMFSFHQNSEGKGGLSPRQKKILLAYNVRRFQELENDINSSMGIKIDAR